MKWFFRALTLILVVLCLLVVGVLFLPGDRLARIASDQLSEQLGRQVTIKGNVRLSVFPTLGVSVDGLTLANATGFSQTPLLDAKAAQIGLEPSMLWGGPIKITEVVINAPQVLLQSRADGTVNWSFEDDSRASSTSGTTTTNSQSTAPSASTATPDTHIARIDIRDALLRFEQENAAAQVIQNVTLDLRWPDPAGPADITASAQMASNPITFVGRISAPTAYLKGGAHPLSGTLSAGGGQATFEGRVSLAPELDGQVSLDASNTSAFLAAFGITGVDLPKGAGKSARVQTQLTFAQNRLSLRGLNAQLDDHTIQGDVDLSLASSPPNLVAKLTTGPLALGQEFTDPDATTGSDTQSPNTVENSKARWSKAPIDASALSLLDADVTVTSEALSLGYLNFGEARMRVRNKRARAVFTLDSLAAYDGLITGEFVMNNRNGLSVGGRLNAAGLNTRTLLTEAGITERLQGALTGNIAFLGVGESMDAIMRSLSGDGAVNIGRGAITGIDLDQLFRAGSTENGTGGGTTIFDQANATFTMAGGVLTNEDLLMTIPDGQATGEGRVNLGAQTINYTITPKSLNARGGRGVAIPVTIKGPWSDPRIDADLAQALELNLQEEVQAAEDRLREQVNDRIADELDVTVEEGETLEDALKDKLEDEVKRGLLNLFGGGD